MEAIFYADKFHRFVFIDYEGQKPLLKPDELEKIVEQIRHFLVFTIAIRGCEFHFQRKHLLENYLRIARNNPHLYFCIVAGHPNYPSIDTQLPLTKAFHNIFTRIREKNSSVLFLGVENVNSKLIQKLQHQYAPIIPFILHGDPRVISNEFKPPIAVYSPLAHSISDEEAIKSLLGYLIRRNITQQELKKKGYSFITPPMNKQLWNDLIPEIQCILRSSFDRFVLTSQNYQTRIEKFIQNGVQLLVGNPAIPEHLFKLIRSFNTTLIPNSSKHRQNISTTRTKVTKSKSEIIRSM
ncbi:MAG: hypothetical protein JSW11_15525 [Candidatus Heimdallarchaeota archaeon]|nr:MAG: hypothetical protein JSW11_15525 [Candidatus Heimdallarchaeota archaeon]